MEKRLFIAIICSIVFLIGWGALAPKFFPGLARKVPESRSTQTPKASDTASSTDKVSAPVASSSETTPAGAAATPVISARPIAPVSATSSREVVVDSPDFVARFSNRGAQLVSFKLKRYLRKGSTEFVDLVKARNARRIDFPFAVETSDRDLTRNANSSLYQVTDETVSSKRTIRFDWADGSGNSVSKTFVFNGAYAFDFKIDVVSPKNATSRFVIGPGLRTLDQNEKDDQFTSTGNAVVGVDDESDVIEREKAPSLQTVEGSPKFIGIEDNYFLSVLKPMRSGEAIFRAINVEPAKGEEKGRRELYAGLNLNGGTASGTAFFGPKEVAVLERYDLDSAVRFGFFSVIAKGLLFALVWLYGATKNYGWAIVVLTILIKIVLYPLQHKSIVSMKKMQKVQPKMTAIRDKYKKAKTDPDQRQKMNVEMMKLYQTEKINPMSGCVPILLQLPILWAFYGLLSHAIELRGAPFMLWITDLSAKDPYYVTPILMTITMFIQQYMTPMSVEPAQRKMFLAMPFIFGWIFKEFPSGLVLYWLVQNILTILQQWIMNRWWKYHPAELAKS